ncbi:MAG TPA: DUF2752 domain-containing protein [Nitriliruptorales bacterium]|jgi:hypothetical protein
MSASSLVGQLPVTSRWLEAPRWVTPTGLGVAAAGATAWVSRVDPNEPGHYPTCLFLQLTGWQCPGCGTLRAVQALTHGDVLAALDLNALTTVLLPMLALGWLAWMRTAVTGRPLAVTVPTAAGWAVAAAVPLFWVARNLPMLSFLAP